MKVNIYGFTWETQPSGHINQFLKFIESENIVQIKNLNHMIRNGFPNTIQNYHRVIAASELEKGVWGGFILTVKDAQKFIQSSKTAKGFRISTASITGINKISEINFFIFNEATGAGLYEYYHNSARLTTLNSTFEKKFLEYKSVNSIGNGKLATTCHLSPTDYADQIARLRKIHNVEYEFSTLAIPSSSANPAPNFVNRQRHKVFYDVRAQAKSNGAVMGVSEFFRDNADKIKRFFVKGLDSNGRIEHYALTNEPSSFKDYEFADFTVDLEFGSDGSFSLLQCSNLKGLLDLTKRPDVSDFFDCQAK